MIKEYKDIFIAIIIALILFGLAYTIFDIRQSILVGTVAFLVTLWTNEALPLGVVSILPIILFPTFGILDIDETTKNYSKSIIFLFLGWLLCLGQFANLRKGLDLTLELFFQLGLLGGLLSPRNTKLGWLYYAL